MARHAEKQKARELRAEGKSYTEIKQFLSVSKSTLSLWLADMPLSKEQLRSIRDLNPRRIENFRSTMTRKRQARELDAYMRAKGDVGPLSARDKFIGGLYLYWAEGLKAQRGTVAIANTDPSVITAFSEWLIHMGVDRKDLRVKLHLYADMDINKETMFWANILGLPTKQFRKPYIKASKLSELTYKGGHGHGTCNLIFDNTRFWEYISMALKFLRECHIRP